MPWVDKRVDHCNDRAFARPLSANFLDLAAFIFELVRGRQAKDVVVVEGRSRQRVAKRIGRVRHAHAGWRPEPLKAGVQTIETGLRDDTEADFLQDRQIRRPQVESQDVPVGQRVTFIVDEEIGRTAARVRLFIRILRA